MTLKLSLDLEGATLAQLHSFMAAAASAGCTPETSLSVEGTSLVIDVDAATLAAAAAPASTITSAAAHSAHAAGEGMAAGHGASGSGPGTFGNSSLLGDSSRPAGPVGEAAIRSVIDILSGKMNPPTRG